MNELKLFLYPDGVYNKYLNKRSILVKKFPHLLSIPSKEFNTHIYMSLNNISDIPKCKNPNCNNKVTLKNMSVGFHTFCSNKCIAQYQKQDKEFALKIQKTKYLQSPLKQKYPTLDITLDKNKNYYLLKNYCKHGDIKVYSSIFHLLYPNKNLCFKCNEEYVLNYIPAVEEIENFQKEFHDFYNTYKFKFTYKWFIYNYPKEFNIINYWSKDIKNTSIPEKIYLFKNNLKERPKCNNCKKRDAHFNKTNLCYTTFCNSASCQKSTSKEELNVYNFIKSLDKEAQHKFYINKNEYDILSKNICIEYNGLYWHSELNHTKDYHYNKRNTAIENGYEFFIVWEDNWKYRTEIIKSIIKSRLNIYEQKIYARNCSVEEINSKEKELFLNENHIQGNCSSSINLGIYYNKKLISLMTFGKKRMVLKSSSSKGEYELLRYCSLNNTKIIGGASKLFSYFVKNYKPNSIISYCNLDLFNGNLYETLGFENKGHTGLNYWWAYKDKRFHRSNFMKHKLIKDGYDPKKTEEEIMIERGYYKIYGCGNLRYEWKQKRES